MGWWNKLRTKVDNWMVNPKEKNRSVRKARREVKADTDSEVNQPCQCSCTIGNGQSCVCDVLPCVECKSCKCYCNYLTN